MDATWLIHTANREIKDSLLGKSTTFKWGKLNIYSQNNKTPKKTKPKISNIIVMIVKIQTKKLFSWWWKVNKETISLTFILFPNEILVLYWKISLFPPEVLLLYQYWMINISVEKYFVSCFRTIITFTTFNNNYKLSGITIQFESLPK